MARKNLYRRISFFVVHHILHTDDRPSRIARRARKLSKLAQRNIHISSGENNQEAAEPEQAKSKTG